MTASAKILTSLHGRRLGIDQGGRLVINGRKVPAAEDEGALIRPQPAPNAVNASATLTVAQQLGGIVTSTTAAAVSAQSATGAALDAALPSLQVDESFDLTFIATGANALTLTVNTGVTIVGAAAVATATSGTFRFRKTGTATYVAYRL